ncbi:hypothetical protein TIFTF001_011806 [Ficus carica]|uniref:Transmembrane protein n=1 Tax=Ficus carica TaxID=3494 RepID=A0AA87ZZD7_FICCA|nr:hypothetical protein TIFTF001_011806 [Ficus carica]
MALSQPKLIWPKEVCRWIFVVLVVGSLLKIIVMPSGCALQLAIFGWIPYFNVCLNDSNEAIWGDRNKRVFEGRWDSSRGVIERAG